MGKPLKDGECRMMRRRRYITPPFRVMATRIDEDTPCVDIRIDGGVLVELTDVDAEELIRQLREALAILPTSK